MSQNKQQKQASATQPNAATPKLSLHGVRKSFGTKHVLNGVDLEIPEGKSMVVIGGSGTGKSVMLKCILGLLAPDSGSIQVDGQDITKLSASRHDALMDQFGMLFQGAALFDSLKVWENVAFSLLYHKRIKRAEARDIALENIIAVGLKPEVADLYPAEISGGMQKRVGLARAVATKPKILFFDEPTTGLDPIMADVINNLIVDNVKKLGATALSITHDMGSVRKIADHVAMIYEGKILWHGPVEDLDHSGNPYVDQFIHGKSQGPIKRRLA